MRITVDPAIVPLDPATVQGLLYSSGVAAKAARDVLQRYSMESSWEEIIEIQWLNESSPQFSPAAESSEQNELYDREMMRELENIYGQEYMRQMGLSPSSSQNRQNQPAGGSDGARGRYRPRSGENPRTPLPPRSAHGAALSATLSVSVHLLDGVVPAANEFLEAVVENLKEALGQAYKNHIAALNDQLEQVQHEHDMAIDVLQGGPSPATASIKESLDRIVDLSALKREMPLGETIEMLRKSVDPPLNIAVLWNDLMDNLQVEPTTPINIDGMASVKLGTALDLLVKGMPSVDAEPMWKIKDDAIVIATAAALGESGELTGQPNTETDIQTLVAQRAGMANQLQNLELTLAGQQARREAIAEQIARAQAEMQEKLAKDEVMRELDSLIRLSEENLSNLRRAADAGRASTSELAQATESLTRARIELAKRREELSKQVGGGQLDQLNGELSHMAIDRAEKEAQRGILSRQIARIQQQLAQASTFDPEAARMRTAKEGLDILARRIAELQVQVANVQPPMVTMIGAN